MPSVWDDPELAGDRIRFEEIGDRGKGRVTRIEKVSYANATGVRMELADVAARQGGSQRQMKSAEIVATQTNLVPQLRAQNVGEGDVVDIELTSIQATAQGFQQKRFNVSVTKGSAPAPAAAAAPAAPPADDDFFG